MCIQWAAIYLLVCLFCFVISSRIHPHSLGCSIHLAHASQLINMFHIRHLVHPQRGLGTQILQIILSSGHYLDMFQRIARLLSTKTLIAFNESLDCFCTTHSVTSCGLLLPPVVLRCVLAWYNAVGRRPLQGWSMLTVPWLIILYTLYWCLTMPAPL